MGTIRWSYGVGLLWATQLGGSSTKSWLFVLRFHPPKDPNRICWCFIQLLEDSSLSVNALREMSLRPKLKSETEGIKMMTSKLSVLIAALGISMVAINSAMAAPWQTFPVYEYLAADKSLPYEQAIAECRHRFGGEAPWVTAEYAGHYGQKGWWCAFRRY